MQSVKIFKVRSVAEVVVATLSLFALFYAIEGLHPWTFHVYWMGGYEFSHGGNPYSATLKHGPDAQFKYSPFFAILVEALRQIEPMRLGIGIWSVTSMLVAFAGMKSWMGQFPKASLGWFAFAIAFMAACTELYVSMSVNQANALVIGLTMIGLARYRDHDRIGAGVLLMLATVLKVYPFVFLVALACYRRKDYLLSAFITGVALFLIPALVVGWQHNYDMHLYWFKLVLNEVSSTHLVDIQGTFQRFGMLHLGQSLNNVVLISSALLYCGFVWGQEQKDWRPWISMVISALLLVNPRTEVYTYVFLSAVYLMMVSYCLESPIKSSKVFGTLLVVSAAALSASCRFIIDEWFHTFDELQILRVLGALVIFFFSAGLTLHAIYCRWIDTSRWSALLHKKLFIQ